MKKQRETLKVDEREDGVFIEMQEGPDRVESRWTMTIERLHSTLAQLGWKRFRHQEGSQIGGDYAKTGDWRHRDEAAG